MKIKATDIYASGQTDGQVLKVSNGQLVFGTGSGGVTSVSQDTAPSLGGDLNLNGHSLTGSTLNYAQTGGSGAFTIDSSSVLLASNGGIAIYANGSDPTVYVNGYFQANGGQIVSNTDGTYIGQLTNDSLEFGSGGALAPNAIAGSDNMVLSVPASKNISFKVGTSTIGKLSADGTSGQVLTTDGSGNWTFATSSGGSSYTLATDSAPSLEANLNTNGHNLQALLTGTGQVTLKAIPTTTTDTPQALLCARNVGDTSTLAAVRAQSTNGVGTVFIDGGSITLRSSAQSPILTMPTTTGTAGQVLTSSGAGATAMTWSTPSSATYLFPGTNYVSGNYYLPEAAETDTGSVTFTTNINYTYLMMMPVYRTVTISSYCYNVYTAATGTVRMGLYQAGSDATSFNLVSGSVTTGSSATATTVTAALTANITLAPGIYFFAVQTSSTPTLWAYRGIAYKNFDLFGTNSIVTAYGLAPSAQGCIGVLVPTTYATGMSSTLTTASAFSVGPFPWVGFKVA